MAKDGWWEGIGLPPAALPPPALALGRLAHPSTLKHKEFPCSLWMRHSYRNTIWKNTEDKMLMYKALPHSVCSE